MKRSLLLASICLALFSGQRLLQSVPEARQGPGAAQRVTAARERAYRANNVGVAYLEQFNYQEAERSFREALKSVPDLAIARLNLAIALLYGGRLQEAAAEARDASRRLPDIPQAHYVLGLAVKADDKPDEAAAAFERVLKLDPEDAGAKVQLGQIHLQQRRYPDAVRLFREALAAEPYNVTAAYNVALALTRSGQAEEGRGAMQRFETLRDSPYGVTYAQTYLAQGKYGEAIASTGAEAELVDAAPPAVTFSDATASAMPAVARTIENAMLFDADADGDLDLFGLREKGAAFLRNSKGIFSDETSKSGLVLPPGGTFSGAIAGDYDNDGRLDLLVLGAPASRLFRQRADGTFEDVTAQTALPTAAPGVASGAFADVDHDGDLDILTVGQSVQLLQNNGTGTFADITAKAGLADVSGYNSVAATDYDNRRDIDFFLMGRNGPSLYRNMRDGTFRDWSKEAGFTALPDGTAVRGALAVSDVNKDGYPDFFYGATNASGAFALSDGQGRFRTTAGPAGTGEAFDYRFVDYDNDGLLDLCVLNLQGMQLFRNQSQGRWVDVTKSVGLAALSSTLPTPGVVAVGDIDSDGDADLLHSHQTGLHLFRNDGGNKNGSLRIGLTARVSNRAGLGAKIEMRAGSLREMLETSSSWPAVTPADLVFGLGKRQAADVVRVLWPSGILQAETALDPKAGRSAPIRIEELDRKPSSCPYLFTWNGTRFEFITDFMGGGEMGGWQGPAVWNQPDPDEYVRIRSDQLQARNGRYELRMTNELEEALFFDRVQLVAVDHPSGVEVFPNEGLRSPPRPAFQLTSTRGARPPARAVDGHGHDVLASLASVDRQYPDDFGLLRIRGYAASHELILSLQSGPDKPVLLMTGWTDYAFSNDNVAASQGGVTMSPPSLQVKDRAGEWRTVIEEIGFPVGRPQTVVVNLEGKFLSDSREVRILTNMRIYWDQILVASSVDVARTTVTRVEPVEATLRSRGLSREISPDGREPFGYDYERVSPFVPWKVMTGRYTREGDVRSLLTGTDDLFVISRPGDEVALSFTALAPPVAGRERTFLLYVHGYSKEMNPRSAVPDTVEPLPFHGMTGYPYGPAEHYPRTKRHRDYQERYNTRVVSRPLPSIDLPAPQR